MEGIPGTNEGLPFHAERSEEVAMRAVNSSPPAYLVEGHEGIALSNKKNEVSLHPDIAADAENEMSGENMGEDADDDCEPSYFVELETCINLISSLEALLTLAGMQEEVALEGPLRPPVEQTKNDQCFRCESKKVHLLPTMSMDPEGAAAQVEKLAKLLEPYQQLPHLLHPHLEAIVPPLLNVLHRFLPCATEIWIWEEAENTMHGAVISSEDKKRATDGTNDRLYDANKKTVSEELNEDPHHLIITSSLGQDFSIFDADAPKEAFHLVSRALYTIIKTAGEKACTSHFPNNVSYYEDVFYTLRWWARSPLRQREWEVRYCLLLWLCNLVLVPFSMHLIDTTAITGTRIQALAAARQSNEAVSAFPVSPPSQLGDEKKALLMVSSSSMPSSSLKDGGSLADATLIAAISFLQDSTKCKDAAALLVARLLTRPDSKNQRDIFFRFTNDIVRAVPPIKRCPSFLWDGLLEVLASSPATCSFTSRSSCTPRMNNTSSMTSDTLDRGEGTMASFQESGLTKKEKDEGTDPGAAAAAFLSKSFLPGVLMAVSKTMKAAAREEVVRYSGALVEFLVENLWDPLLQGPGKEGEKSTPVSRGDTLLVKLCVKVVQRLVLSMLPNRHASWRYCKSTTVVNLAANLSSMEGEESRGIDSPKNDHNTKITNRRAEGMDVKLSNVGNVQERGIEEECEFDEEAIDENVLELGIGLLLEALGHHDTVVRWSAAKGIGRICDRLPAKMATEVIQAVLDLLSKGDDEFDYNDRVWHGGMLAMAELCRRGLLLKDKLVESAPLMEKGLSYDVIKGTYSVGAHVRDAAAYSCWSLARAYDAEDLLPHVYRLSGALVATSLLDRHVNVRRAASAAFQECVGRLGTFPHGIPLCTMMDFFSLSSLSNAYLKVTPKVAVYSAYRRKILEVLVYDKLLHWDRSVRVVAAEALGRVARLELLGVDAEESDGGVETTENGSSFQQGLIDHNDINENTLLKGIFPELLDRITNNMVSTRHGAILGVAGLVRHLPSHALYSSIQGILSIIPRLDAARLFRSRGGEYVREACCQLLEAIASHPLPIPETISITRINGTVGRVKTLGKLQEFMEDSWANILDWLQLTATRTFLRFASTYYKEFFPAFHGKILHKMLFSLIHESVPLLQRRGVIGALGGVPKVFLLAYPPKSILASPCETERGERAVNNSSAHHGSGSINSGSENASNISVSYWVLILALLCQLAIPFTSSPLTSATISMPEAEGTVSAKTGGGEEVCVKPEPQLLSKSINELRNREPKNLVSLCGGWEALESVLVSCISALTSSTGPHAHEETEMGSAGPTMANIRAVLEATAADHECRRNAVKALCHAFTAVPRGSFPTMTVRFTTDGVRRCSEEAVVATEVVNTLLKALEDYATDHRGDVGSVVRIAVLEELPAVAVHAHELLSFQEVDHHAPASPSLFVRVLQGVLRALFEKLDRVRECAGRVLETLLLNDEATTSRLLSGCTEEEKKEVRILQQAVLQQRQGVHEEGPSSAATFLTSSKETVPSSNTGLATCKETITVPEHSPSNTSSMGTDPVQEETEAPGISCQPHPSPPSQRSADSVVEVTAGLRKHDVWSWRSPQIMTNLGPVLLCFTPHCFSQAVMDGIVTSAGDLTDYIRKPAMQALRKAFSGLSMRSTFPSFALAESASKDDVKSETQRNDHEKERNEEVLTTMERRWGRRATRTTHFCSFSKLLVEVSLRHCHEERMVLPLSRVLDVLFTDHLLSPSVHVAVMEFLRREMKHFATAIRTLLIMTPLLGSLCRSPCEAARKQAWMLSLTMIASRYPKVRAVMASEFYTALLSLNAVPMATDGAAFITCSGTGGKGEECPSHLTHKNEEGTLEDEEEEWLPSTLGIPSEGCVKAMEHLQRTTWDGTDATAIRRARYLLYPMLGLTPPLALATNPKKSTTNAEPKREMVASTYRTLVDEAGY